MLIDGVDVTGHLQLLAEQAAVKGLARYDPGADKHDLRSCANTVSWKHQTRKADESTI